MSAKQTSTTGSPVPMVYQIRVRGHLSSQRADWFEGMILTREAGGNTTLTGPVADQAALHGLLKKVRDAGMILLSVLCLNPGQTDTRH